MVEGPPFSISNSMLCRAEEGLFPDRPCRDADGFIRKKGNSGKHYFHEYF